METKGLDDLFLQTVQDVYYAEHEILASLPELELAATSEWLRNGFAQHRSETKTQLRRLERVFASLGAEPAPRRCRAIEGILSEARDVLRAYQQTSAGDAGLIAGAQAVEHYEIARYRTLARWARDLGLNEAALLFAESLAEETAAEQFLTDVAEAVMARPAAGLS